MCWRPLELGRVSRSHCCDGHALERQGKDYVLETDVGNADASRVAECAATASICFAAVVVTVERHAGILSVSPILGFCELSSRMIVARVSMRETVTMPGVRSICVDGILPMRGHHKPCLNGRKRNDKNQQRRKHCPHAESISPIHHIDALPDCAIEHKFAFNHFNRCKSLTEERARRWAIILA